MFPSNINVYIYIYYNINKNNIRPSEKFLSFYKEVMDAQHFSFYIILPNYV